MRRSVLAALCGVYTDPLDEDGVELFSPGGVGQKFLGMARPNGVATPVGVGADPVCTTPGPVLRCGAQGQTVLRHDVPASVGVQTGAAPLGVTVTALGDATKAWTGS